MSRTSGGQPLLHVVLDLVINAFIKEQVYYSIIILFLYFNIIHFLYNPMYFIVCIQIHYSEMGLVSLTRLPKGPMAQIRSRNWRFSKIFSPISVDIKVKFYTTPLLRKTFSELFLSRRQNGKGPGTKSRALEFDF